MSQRMAWEPEPTKRPHKHKCVDLLQYYIGSKIDLWDDFSNLAPTLHECCCAFKEHWSKTVVIKWPTKPWWDRLDCVLRKWTLERVSAYLVQTLSIKARRQTDRERARETRRVLCSAALRNEGGPFSHMIDVLRAAPRCLDVYWLLLQMSAWIWNSASWERRDIGALLILDSTYGAFHAI